MESIFLECQMFYLVTSLAAHGYIAITWYFIWMTSSLILGYKNQIIFAKYSLKPFLGEL